MTPFVGGTGGSPFTNACNPGELMIGLDVMAGDAIDAVRPICAPPAEWDQSGTGLDRAPSFSGGPGGGLMISQCPQFQFLVGLNLWTGSVVNGLQVVCRDMR